MLSVGAAVAVAVAVAITVDAYQKAVVVSVDSRYPKPLFADVIDSEYYHRAQTVSAAVTRRRLTEACERGKVPLRVMDFSGQSNGIPGWRTTRRTHGTTTALHLTANQAKKNRFIDVTARKLLITM
jgi:hypothetical protein